MARTSSGLLTFTSVDTVREFLQTAGVSEPIHTLRIDAKSDPTDSTNGSGLGKYWDEMEELLAKVTDLDNVQIRNFEQIIPNFPLPMHAMSKMPVHTWNTLESLSIQYNISTTEPSLPTETIEIQVQSFCTSLLSVFRTMSNLRRLRLSLPHSYTPPYSYFLEDFLSSVLANPNIFPEIEVVDVTHSGPRYDVILAIIEAHKGTLKHLILDQGVDFNMPVSGERIGSPESDDDEQGSPALAAGSADPLFFTWAGIGRAISSWRKDLGPEGFPFQSLCAAKCDVTMSEEAFMPTPVDREAIMKMMRFASHDQDGDAVDLDWLVVCTAWPGEDEQHSEGCGHLSGWGGAFEPKNIWYPVTRTQLLMGDMTRSGGHTTL